MAPRILEVCIDEAGGLAAALQGGAQRIELCSALALGGLTPSAGLMALAAQAPTPVYAMVRPHGRSFVLGAADLRQMLHDIDAVAEAGLAGVVLGASLPSGALDVTALEGLTDRARGRGLGLTLHRAFDLTPDPAEALEQAIGLGFERILTSGGEPSAVAGAERIAALVAQAAGRIAIMPGGGVRSENIAELVRRTGASQVHASCSAPAAPDPLSRRVGLEAPGRRTTRADIVAALAEALASA